MQIHVSRGSQSLGQFSEEELRAGIESGKFLGDDLVWTEGMETWLPVSQLERAVPDMPPPRSEPIPWENRAELGFFSALFGTIALLVCNPKKAFSSPAKPGSMGSSLLFGIIMGTVGFAFSMFYQFVLSLLASSDTSSTQAPAVAFTGVVMVAMLVLSPVFVATGLFVASGITHLSLMILRGANRPFENTFRVVCYASSLSSMMQILPFCGSTIGGLWALVVQVVGVYRTNGIGPGRATAAVLLPLILCLCAVLLAIGIPIFFAGFMTHR